MNLIVDASVGAKYLIPETDTDKARALFMAWQGGQIDILAPEILPIEVASALWKRARRGLASAAEVTRLLAEFMRVGVPLVPLDELGQLALQLALRNGHSVYDGLYVALTLVTGWEFITADERLYNLLNPTMSQVHRLGDWG
jgi:predicted nucleic acid-binding protein